MRTLVPVLVAAVLLSGTGSRSAAQDLQWTLGSPTAGLPGDVEGSTQYELNDGPTVELREIESAGPDLVRVGTLPRASLAGFDARRFPVAAIEAYFDRAQGPAEDRSDLSSTATLRLTIRTLAADGTVRWWHLAGESKQLVIRDEPVEPTGPPNDDQVERLVLATADPRLPIVDVQYSSTMLYVNSSGDTRHHLLLDFRAETPRIIGFFDETDGAGCGGACTVYDCIFGITEEVGCRWDFEHDGFLCARTIRRRDRAWADRRATSYFHFGTKAQEALVQPASPYAEGFDPRVERALTPDEGRAKLVAGYGTVSAIALAGVGKRAAILVGAPSMSWHFGARFFAALTDYPYRGPLHQIESRLDVRAQEHAEGGTLVERLENEDLHSAREFEGHTPDGPRLHFVPTKLAAAGNLTILRVLVTEGAGKGVYLVGLELADDRLVTDAMMIATNGESHLHCNTWRVPATAVGMTVTAKPFAATLDVEPAHIRDEGPSQQGDPLEPPPPDACRMRSTLEWESGHGFRYATREKQCGAAPPRRVRIDDDGNIGVAPPAATPPL